MCENVVTTFLQQAELQNAENISYYSSWVQDNSKGYSSATSQHQYRVIFLYESSHVHSHIALASDVEKMHSKYNYLPN